MKQMQLTSLEAYDSIQNDKQTLQLKVLNALESSHSDGMTIEEIVNSTGIKLQTVCARRKELENQGLVFNTGRRRKTSSGRTAIVWATVDEGDIEWDGDDMVGFR